MSEPGVFSTPAFSPSRSHPKEKVLQPIYQFPLCVGCPPDAD